MTPIETVQALNEAIVHLRAINALLAQPQETAVPQGMLDRVKAAEQRVRDNLAPRRIPADPTDVDLVLAEVRHWIEGKRPPFWIASTGTPLE